MATAILTIGTRVRILWPTHLAGREGTIAHQYHYCLGDLYSVAVDGADGNAEGQWHGGLVDLRANGEEFAIVSDPVAWVHQ